MFRKFLMSSLFIALFPFAVLLAYMFFLSETKMLDQITTEQSKRVTYMADLINNHIQSIDKEAGFIASLDLMDDILVDDIDKRISILLEKKVKDLNLDISLFVVNQKNIIVAASDKEVILNHFNLFTKSNKSYLVQNNYLYILHRIHASFDIKKPIGSLIVKYNLNNLNMFLLQQNGIHAYITNQTDSFYVGSKLQIPLNITKEQGSFSTEKYLVTYKQLATNLKKYFLVYAVDKDVALGFLYDFIHFMFYAALLLLPFIFFIAFRFSKTMITPIKNLTQATQNIIEKQDYSTILKLKSHDEIALLTDAFNSMLQKTSQLLHMLELENKLRLQRFVQLIDLFNTINQTVTQDECIETSLKEIKKITQRDDLAFCVERKENNIALYVTDFDTNSKKYFGSITLSVENFQDENEKNFYLSIATMMGLQLDRIRLIEKTLSASNAKSAFISHMSHELRTPLNAIIGSSQFLITYEALTEKQQDAVGSIESAAYHLLNMFNDILDIAKIEAGKMDVNLKSIDLKTLLENVYSMFLPLAEDKNLSLNLHINNVEYLTTDAKILQQVVINIVSNAIKFTKDGFINIKLFHDVHDIKIVVEDSGIGIAKEDLQMLFEDFTQVKNNDQKQFKGTGLGLALSKKMTELLGGKIILESEGTGKGSRVTLIFRRENDK